MDIEKGERHAAMADLAEWFEVQEECSADLLDGSIGRIDILARPKHPDYCDMSLAFEIKICRGDHSYGAWMRQCYNYVDGVPRNGWPAILAALMWMDSHDFGAEEVLIGQQISAHFHVGIAEVTSRSGLCLRIGPHTIFRAKRDGWTPRAVEIFRTRRKASARRLERVRGLLVSQPAAPSDGPVG